MKHLKDAVEGYNCDHDGRIRPISEIDTEIIKELIQILDLKGGNKDLIKVLKKWKKEQDGFVLDELIQYSMSLDGMGDESMSGSDKKKEQAKLFLNISKDLSIPVNHIYVIEKIFQWKDRNVYSLVINPTKRMHEKIVTFLDIEIDFYTEEDCDNFFTKLKKELEENVNVKFINL